MKWHKIYIAAAATFVSGCGRETGLGKNEIHDLAIKTAVAKGMSNPRVDFMECKEEKWTVSMTDLPISPGSHAIVIISKNGKNIEFVHGR